MALVALAGAANAQTTVTFRIVERTSQVVANSADSLLELAVQARVSGTPAYLGGFNFNILTGDSESGGFLQKARIMQGGNPNFYSTTTPWNSNSSVGSGGLAGQYTYLAGINADFNGVINASSGTFTNNPAENEIGLIAGAVTGDALTHTPGIDDDGDNIPDTAPSNGTMPPHSNNNETAAVDPTIGAQYFAGGAQFIDIYRFRYNVTNFTQRTLHFSLGDLGAQFFNELLFNNGAWGANNVTAPLTAIVALPLNVQVTPTPASVALMGLGGLMVARRRRA